MSTRCAGESDHSPPLAPTLDRSMCAVFSPRMNPMISHGAKGAMSCRSLAPHAMLDPEAGVRVVIILRHQMHPRVPQIAQASPRGLLRRVQHVVFVVPDEAGADRREIREESQRDNCGGSERCPTR